MNDKKGKVYLIGAGPGDTGLLTLRGKEILEQSQTVIYDSLVNPHILRFCRGDAELIFVGKRKGHAYIAQEEINRLLVKSAEQGKTVARLKGGDPFVFGRGGEEAEALAERGIEIEVVPGVSSITSVPAYGGIPVTHRKYNSSFAVFTGHDGGDFDPDPTRINTMVFLMGLGSIENIMKKLLELGKKPSTPVAVISRGTLPEQVSVLGTISDIVEKTTMLEVQTPATIVVGEVSTLGERTSWYERKPLFGKTVIITREASKCCEFSRTLVSLGAGVVEFPTIEIRPVRGTKTQESSVYNVEKYDFLIFTSVNGVNHYFDVLKSYGKDSRTLGGKEIIAIGENTSQELAKYNIFSDYLPYNYTAEGVISVAEKLNFKGKKVLIPRALEAREILPETFREMGADVEVLCVYETIVPDYGEDELDGIKEKIEEEEIDLVTFTSSSTAKNFFSLLGKTSGFFTGTEFASIGPVTTATLKTLGFDAVLTADVHTVRGLTEKILEFYS